MQAAKWNGGLCYRCNQKPQFRGKAWCHTCLLKCYWDIAKYSADTKNVSLALRATAELDSPEELATVLAAKLKELTAQKQNIRIARHRIVLGGCK
jgi:hypothetical protein